MQTPPQATGRRLAAAGEGLPPFADNVFAAAGTWLQEPLP